jgi:hypothetical protein
VDRAAKILLNQLEDVGDWRRRNLILQTGKLKPYLIGDDIGTGAEKLPKLNLHPAHINGKPAEAPCHKHPSLHGGAADIPTGQPKPRQKDIPHIGLRHHAQKEE